MSVAVGDKYFRYARVKSISLAGPAGRKKFFNRRRVPDGVNRVMATIKKKAVERGARVPLFNGRRKCADKPALVFGAPRRLGRKAAYSAAVNVGLRNGGPAGSYLRPSGGGPRPPPAPFAQQFKSGRGPIPLIMPAHRSPGAGRSSNSARILKGRKKRPAFKGILRVGSREATFRKARGAAS